MKTVHAILSKDGQIRLAEPVEFEGDQHVLVTFIDNKDEEEFIGGYPVSLLLARPSLADWDRAEEDEAWKNFQDKAR
jgi:hypothetical protein